MYCVTTWPRTLASHSSADWAVGRPNSGPRSCTASSMDGRVLKNSTPAEKSLIVRPVFGSSRMPPGTEAEINTPSGPSSDTAKRMVKPPTPEKAKPPWTPTKNTRSSTRVVVSRLPIWFPLASSLMMPPISAASIWPPNRSPFTETPIEAMSRTGNLPWRNSPISMTMPSTAPENSRPLMPCSPVTAAERISWKLPGSFCRLSPGQMIPISVMRIGSHSGHMKLPPSAEPMLRNTPKPALALNEPLPRKAKLRASPPSFSEPTVISAPTDSKLTNSSLSAAPVLMNSRSEVSVRKDPSVILRVSTSKMKALTSPFSNLRDARMASVSGTPGRISGSAVVRSLIVADTGRPGRNLAPPEATKIVPVNAVLESSVPSKKTLKSLTPIRRSSNSRMLPKAILPPPLPVCVRAEALPLEGSAPPSGS